MSFVHLTELLAYERDCFLVTNRRRIENNLKKINVREEEVKINWERRQVGLYIVGSTRSTEETFLNLRKEL